ncbi:MAG: ecotin [Sulfurovum sp.]|nr:MAG: ecotin [Sulfurovum sp.]
MFKNITLALSLLLAASSLYAEPAKNENSKKDKYHMFPEAKAGYERYIVDVPKTDNDYDHKIELLIGKNLMVDCNHASLSGKIENKSLKGWGYHYLEVSDIQRGPTTMMACPDSKTEKFISIRDTLRRYNSRLGTVIYAPKGFEVRYRVWSAGDTVKQAEQR